MLVRWTLSLLARLGLVLLIGGFLTVLLVRFSPGFGVDERELDPTLSEATRAAFRQAPERRSVWVTYVRYLRDALHGDLGISASLNAPVTQLLAERAPVTGVAVASGLALAWIVALPLAAMGALWRNTALPLIAASAVLLCIPVGLIAVYCFLANLPATGVIAAGVGPKVFIYSRQLLAASELRPHVLSAASRGVRPWRLFWLHRVLPIAPEVAALLGVSITMALGAAIPAEALCDSPGLGQLVWKAAVSRDMAPLLSLTWLTTGVAFIANTLGGSAARSERTWHA